MRHQVAGCKLGRTTSHRNAMLRNMVTSLIMCDRIETTLPKAKELRRWADKMVTLAKDGSLAARRRALEIIKNRDALQKLFSTLVDRYKDRKGGYTRIIKLGFRHGDNAPMAIIEYLTAEVKSALKKGAGSKKSATAAQRAHKAEPKAGKSAVARKTPSRAKKKASVEKAAG